MKSDSNDKQRDTVLIIAAVDSGGGAGITADCITVHDMGAFPLPCTVAVTAQSLEQVAAVEPLSDQTTKTALDLTLSDWPQRPAAVKIGFIPLQSTLSLIIDFLKTSLAGTPVVWDPVLTATAGRMESADLKAELNQILEVTTIFTPNLPEALELAGWDEQRLKSEGREALGKEFLKHKVQAVIIKGGHTGNEGEALDVFVSRDLTFSMSYGKKKGDGAHGGGCALSSALAALLAQGYALEDAAVLAKAYVTEGILKPQTAFSHKRPPIGHYGFPKDLMYMPKVLEPNFPKGNTFEFKKCPLRMGLYPVVDSIEFLTLVLEAGVRTAQLRIKGKDDPNLFDKIQKAVALGRKYHARVFINDHYELAIKAGAYGVHLGMEDLKEADLNKIKDADLRLGISTHGIYELLKALALKPSYIAIGHIFDTTTKVMKGKPQGVTGLAYQTALLKDTVPTVAIAGIKLTNLEGVLAAKAGSVAVVTALTKAEDPVSETKKWLKLCGSGGDLND